MKSTLLTVTILFLGLVQFAQSPCSHAAIMGRHALQNPDAEIEQARNEAMTREFIKQLKANRSAGVSEIVIPVVMHVFHWGDDGMMGMAQALSGLEVLNNDFNGLNDGWETIDPEFDPIKGTMDITFCLATIDPDGNPTTGINYIEDQQMMLNEGNLFQYAWDNYKYLNIYFPKYTSGEPSLFTAYAYYPSTFNTENDIDGIFYSSIRWGYGEDSELEDGQDWASVCSHEVGHWLNLRHTFEDGCFGQGDLVDDTPPCEGGTIELEGCDNYDFSCGVATNGENFMNYNHDCKKMFTQGQVDRMTAALSLPSRINLWSFDNLVATGCEQEFTAVDESNAFEVKVSPNPGSGLITFTTSTPGAKLQILNLNGSVVHESLLSNTNQQVDLSELSSGIYVYRISQKHRYDVGKLVLTTD